MSVFCACVCRYLDGTQESYVVGCAVSGMLLVCFCQSDQTGEIVSFDSAHVGETGIFLFTNTILFV